MRTTSHSAPRPTRPRHAVAGATDYEPVAEVVAGLRAPLLVVLGTMPRPAGPAVSEFAALAPLGARLRLVEIAGVGHFVHEEAPDELARLLAPVRAPRAASGLAVRR